MQTCGLCQALAFLLGVQNFGTCRAEAAYGTGPPVKTSDAEILACFLGQKHHTDVATFWLCSVILHGRKTAEGNPHAPFPQMTWLCILSTLL